MNKTRIDLAVIESLIGNSQRNKAVISMVKRYTELSLLEGRIAFPVSYRSVAEFIIYFVDQQNGSTKSIGNILSCLRVFSYYCKCSWLTDAMRYKLKGVIKHLEFKDTSAIARKKPLTLSAIQPILNSLDMNNNSEFMVGMMMLICHNSLMRSGELLSGIKVNDIQWDFHSRSFTIRLFRSKANRKGEPEFIRVVDYQGPSAFKFLHEWFNRFNLWVTGEAYIFPCAYYALDNEATFNFSMNVTKTWWRKQLIWALNLVGMETTYYSGHSFRAGGATDLFVARVPYNIIKAMGRWKSDAALKYYRDEVDIATAVAAAFGDTIRQTNNNAIEAGW